MKIFSPSTIIERSKLDLSIRNSTSLNIFEGRLLQFERPLENSVFTIHNPVRIKYLTRLRIGLCCRKLIRFVTEAQQLKILFITTFTLPTFQLHEIPFSMKSQLLTDPLLIKMKSKLFKLSIMENQSVLSTITN